MSQNQSASIDLIRRIISSGRYSDLYELVVRVSEFNIPIVSLPDMSAEDEEAWRYARMHLDFLSKYGAEQSFVQEGKYLHFSYPAEFEAWLGRGAPGISQEELEHYLIARPL
ncbi:hypothetical protein ACS5PN_28035 [Roseateles sp. NT4]|uniref:hypothetical protein n=1 Tax=Roseateles sp. NT4 TaxID=3453715 RepID=UPI003EE9131B